MHQHESRDRVANAVSTDADSILTGAKVYKQFHNMDSDPRKCTILFTSDPFQSSSESGMEKTEFDELSAQVYVASKGVTQYSAVKVLDWRHSYDWITSGISFTPPDKVDCLIFTLHGSQCLLNVYFACNAGASSGLGDVAACSTADYWRYLFEKNKIPYESCGQDNKGIKPSQDKLFTLTLVPYAMTATFNRF